MTTFVYKRKKSEKLSIQMSAVYTHTILTMLNGYIRDNGGSIK